MTWKIGDTRLFRWSSSLSRSPSLVVLLALGWTIEAVDERYYSVLLSCVEMAQSTTEVS